MTGSLNFDAPFLAGKIAIVTGASAGIGRHMAMTLARRGAGLGLIARSAHKLDAVVAEIEGLQGRAVAVAADITDAAAVDAAVESLVGELGRVDLLVNNAGISVVKPALELSIEDWNRVIDTNLNGAWYTARAAARHMAAQGGGGNIINISSMLGARTATLLHSYCASKAGVDHMTRALALEWGRLGIRVNALAPGYVITDMTRDFLTSPAAEAMIQRIPTRRLGEVEDLDGPLLLLASDASRHITGVVIPIDGGHSVSSI